MKEMKEMKDDMALPNELMTKVSLFGLYLAEIREKLNIPGNRGRFNDAGPIIIKIYELLYNKDLYNEEAAE